LLASHLDTVSPGDGWETDPFSGEIVDDTLYGRGAVDARGACVAMLLAAKEIKDSGIDCGRMVVCLSIGEEGNDPSLPRLLQSLGSIDAAIIGEPTNMQIAISQLGLMILELVTRGEQGHAARTSGDNAITELSHDVLKLQELSNLDQSACSGVRLTPTRFNAGLGDNVTPPDARAIIDVRTPPASNHADIRAWVQENMMAKVHVVADQWIPCNTPNDSFLEMVKSALPQSDCFHSDATSDWVFVQQAGIRAVKIGPGQNVYSHKPNERITRDELEAGINGYQNIMTQFFDKQIGR